MEKPPSGRPVHGVTASANCKQKAAQHRSAPLPPKVPATAALRRSSAAATDWTKKPVHRVKRKLEFEGSEDPHNSKLDEGTSKKKKQQSTQSSSACDVSVSYVSKAEVPKQPHLKP